jgi:hypothetical protein
MRLKEAVFVLVPGTAVWRALAASLKTFPVQAWAVDTSVLSFGALTDTSPSII